MGEQTHIIEFSPPMNNLVGEFNTIRLGIKLSRVLSVGEEVLLIDKPNMCVFNRAVVTGIYVGQLGEMAMLHAAQNHNQKGLPTEGAPDRLIANLTKRYGPHLILSTKRVTVVYLSVL